MSTKNIITIAAITILVITGVIVSQFYYKAYSIKLEEEKAKNLIELQQTIDEDSKETVNSENTEQVEVQGSQNNRLNDCFKEVEANASNAQKTVIDVQYQKCIEYQEKSRTSSTLDDAEYWAKEALSCSQVLNELYDYNHQREQEEKNECYMLYK